MQCLILLAHFALVPQRLAHRSNAPRLPLDSTHLSHVQRHDSSCFVQDTGRHAIFSVHVAAAIRLVFVKSTSQACVCRGLGLSTEHAVLSAASDHRQKTHAESLRNGASAPDQNGCRHNYQQYSRACIVIVWGIFSLCLSSGIMWSPCGS